MDERRFFAWVRTLRGLSQRELADKVGMSLSHVKKVESCSREMSSDFKRSLTRALGLTAEELVEMRLLYERTFLVDKAL